MCFLSKDKRPVLRSQRLFTRDSALARSQTSLRRSNKMSRITEMGRRSHPLAELLHKTPSRTRKNDSSQTSGRRVAYFKNRNTQTRRNRRGERRRRREKESFRVVRFRKEVFGTLQHHHRYQRSQFFR